LRAQLRGDALRSLTDDFEVPHHRILVDNIAKERVPARTDAAAHPLTSLPNAMQVHFS
jgi:hypothetical protein